MEYRVKKDKVNKLKGLGIAISFALIYAIKFIGVTGFLHLTYNLITNNISSTLNFTQVEFLIIASNFLLVFVLLILYFSLKQNKIEDIILDKEGILFYKLNIFLKTTKFKVKWNDIKIIETRRIIYLEDNFKEHIQIKLITKNGKIILLPKQPPDENTCEFRVALDEFVEKYRPEIKINNL